MPFEGEGLVKRFVQLPREGASYDFSIHGEIEKIEKVDNFDHKKGKFNFTKKMPILDPTTQEPIMKNGQMVKVDEDQGYFYLITFVDGTKLSISSWSPFFALKEAEVAEGDKIIIDHEGKGIWKITKL